MSASFLFLEITDVEIANLLSSLRETFTGKKSNNIHLTVRGPYKKTITSDDVNKWYKKISDNDLLIHKVGKFSNDGFHVVYLSVECEGLKSIWDKPDYPVDKYGFNPHISIYVGEDKKISDCCYEFLKNEQIALLCRSFKLSPYISKQADMFPGDTISKGHHFLELSNKRLVKADVLQRAYNVMKACSGK